jgi:hypothetical protein
LQLEPEEEIGFGVIRSKPTNTNQTECGVRGWKVEFIRDLKAQQGIIIL